MHLHTFWMHIACLVFLSEMMLSAWYIYKLSWINCEISPWDNMFQNLTKRCQTCQ